jgi:hypothetical protein
MSDLKAIVPLNQDADWSEIVTKLVNELNENDLPDKVVQATEMLLAGYPTHKVAKKLGTTTETVRRWISTYPTMAAVVVQGKDLLSKWRMAKLEQQFLSAVERSQEILELPLNGVDKDDNRVDPKILTVVAAQARYVIGLFAGQKVDVEVRHELGQTVLKARQDALDYLAERLLEQQANAQGEPIETTFRVIDAKLDANGPLLDEEGDPPFGAMGKLDTNEDGVQCHVCGKRLKYLGSHILSVHGMGTQEYENLYMLEPGAVKKSESS